MCPRHKVSTGEKPLSAFRWIGWIACAALVACVSKAEDLPGPKAEQPPAAPAPPTQGANEKPPSESSSFIQDALARATTLAHAGDHVAAGAVVDEVAKRLGPKDAFVDELRGTVLTLKKDYGAAEASFQAMLEKAPDSHVARFNLAEMMFLQARYDEGERAFAALESTRREADPALADLCRFKRVVSFLAGGRVEEAEALLPRSEKGPSSPAVQYSRAAIRFVKKLPARAAETINHARTEFSRDVENLFVDSFIELNWGSRDSEGKFSFAASK